jgi:hypothetical protein
MCQRAQIFVNEEEVEVEDEPVPAAMAARPVTPPDPAPNDPRLDAVAVSR